MQDLGIYLLSFLSSLGISEQQWAEGYPLLIFVGTLAAWFGGKLGFETNAKTKKLLPFLPDSALHFIDLILSIVFSIIFSLIVFRPDSPMSALTAGFTWTTALELVGGRSKAPEASPPSAVPPSPVSSQG